jgi:hypothetical protein
MCAITFAVDEITLNKSKYEGLGASAPAVVGSRLDGCIGSLPLRVGIDVSVGGGEGEDKDNGDAIGCRTLGPSDSCGTMVPGGSKGSSMM